MKALKITAIFLLTGFTFAALGSIGGGTKAKSTGLIRAEFLPVKTSRGFTIRGGLTYKGSLILKEERTKSFVNYTSLVTYERGNSTFLLPNKYKLSLAPSSNKNCLQLVNLKIKLSK
ncbi:MAG: hypothetical protein INR73_04020 [Williamsia sp.]|nr:hypothetical protein [Williamsia sp.]